MKKYILIFISIIVAIWGFNSIKNNSLLKDVFVFNDNDIISTTLLKEQSVPDDFEYQIPEDLANNISKVLINSKKQRISGDKFSNSYSTKGIEIFLDGQKKDTKEDFSLIFKRKIALIKEENDNIHVAIDINNIENNNMTNLLSRYYIIKSKELSDYIDQLYK